MDAFDAFFGAGAELGGDSQPMIDALRGQKREGDFASLSTIGGISDFGKRQSKQALAAGAKAGGLKMAREAEQRKKEEEASRFTRGAALAKSVAAEKVITDRAESDRNLYFKTRTAEGVAEQKQKDLIAGKQFDVDNREVKPPKKMGYGEAELYEDEQGNQMWGMEGDDGLLYRDSGIGGGKLSPMVRQDLTKVVPENKGSQAATKKSVPMYNQSDPSAANIMATQQDDGTFKTPSGKVLTDEWTSVDPSDGKDGKGGTGVVKLTGANAEKISKQVRNASQAYGALSNMEPDFGNKGGIPLKGSIESFITTYAPMFSSEEMDRKGEGWKQLLRFNDMLKKNEMFGSALSKNESKSWVAANITKDSTPEQLEAYVNMLKGVIGQEMSGAYNTHKALYGDEIMDVVYRDWDDNAYKNHMAIDGKPEVEGSVNAPAEALSADLQSEYDLMSPEEQAEIDAMIAGGG